MTPDETRDRVLLTHIAECLKRIRTYSCSDRATFFESELVQDAVVRNLQTLAESTQRISDSLKAAEPDVPWRSIAGFRNVLVHGYLGLDLDVVWGVVEQDLPQLAEAVERMTQAVAGDDAE